MGRVEQESDQGFFFSAGRSCTMVYFLMKSTKFMTTRCLLLCVAQQTIQAETSAPLGNLLASHPSHYITPAREGLKGCC